MIGDKGAGPLGAEHGGSAEFGYEWVTRGRVEDFAKRIQAIREGEAPISEDSEKAQPAVAIRALHAFAVKRSTAELVESSACFEYRDAVNVLATAALCRDIKQAAELAIRQWDAECADGSGATELTNGIIHDIACQRTALDVAVFVRECRRAGKPELVDRTLRVFAGAGSGRTNLDKALLHFALRDEECAPEAAELLRLTLDVIGEEGPPQAPDTDPAEFHDLVGALHHLSPSERVLETWLDGRLKDPNQAPRTIRLVVHLILDQVGKPATLVEHVGARWKVHELVDVCGELFKRSPAKCAAVRRYAASRPDVAELADIVIAWQRSETLTRTTKDLLADIVAMETAQEAGAAGPRPLSDIDGLAAWLSNYKAHPQCNRLLRMAAAQHIDGRSGGALAALLRKVEHRRDRQRVAQAIGARLAALALESPRKRDLFIEYIKELRDSGCSEEVYAARRELADPSGPGQVPCGAPALIAEIADRLYREGLADDGWDVLERCLENEQRVGPRDVAAVVARLRGSEMDAGDRHFLIRATVGRWSDMHRRDQAVEELRLAGFDQEAASVIRSLR